MSSEGAKRVVDTDAGEVHSVLQVNRMYVSSAGPTVSSVICCTG